MCDFCISTQSVILVKYHHISQSNTMDQTQTNSEQLFGRHHSSSLATKRRKMMPSSSSNNSSSKLLNMFSSESNSSTTGLYVQVYELQNQWNTLYLIFFKSFGISAGSLQYISSRLKSKTKKYVPMLEELLKKRYLSK